MNNNKQILSATEIFKAEYKKRSGKDADETVMQHMDYCIRAMHIYAEQFDNKPIPQQPEQVKPSLHEIACKQPKQQADGGELSRVATYINGDCFLLDKYKGKTVAVIPYELHEQSVQQERERVDSDLNKLISGNVELRNTIEQLQSQLEQWEKDYQTLYDSYGKHDETINKLKSELEAVKVVKIPKLNYADFDHGSNSDFNYMSGFKTCVGEFKYVNPKHTFEG